MLLVALHLMCQEFGVISLFCEPRLLLKGDHAEKLICLPWSLGDTVYYH